jgi:hypothetical protein
MKERGHLGDQGIDVTILKWIPKETGCGGVDWIHLVKGRVEGRVLVQTFLRNVGSPEIYMAPHPQNLKSYTVSILSSTQAIVTYAHYRNNIVTCLWLRDQ